MAAKRSIVKSIADKYKKWPDIWNELLGMATDSANDEQSPGNFAGLHTTEYSTDENSLIYKLTEKTITTKDRQVLSIDKPGSDAHGDINSVIGDWFYYVFDWRNYQNTKNEKDNYNPTTHLADYFRDMAIASLPYALSLLGKRDSYLKGEVPIDYGTFFKKHNLVLFYNFIRRASIYL